MNFESTLQDYGESRENCYQILIITSAI